MKHSTQHIMVIL